MVCRLKVSTSRHLHGSKQKQASVMRKFLLPVLLSLTLAFCFEACKPEKIPENQDKRPQPLNPNPNLNLNQSLNQSLNQNRNRNQSQNRIRGITSNVRQRLSPMPTTNMWTTGERLTSPERMSATMRHVMTSADTILCG